MYSVNGNCFRISVRNLVEFMCAEGDIDNRNTGSNDVKIMQEGARIHRKIQHSMGTMYHAEVPLKIEIPLVSELGIEYVLQVEGRADGIIADINYDEDGNKEPESDAIIDEIKTMQTDVSLLKEPKKELLLEKGTAEADIPSRADDYFDYTLSASTHEEACRFSPIHNGRAV